MHASYPLDMTMRIARDRYFEANGFGDDGGYNDKWVEFKLGPLVLPFPNTKGRIAAVKFHDLHHVLTGYETNAAGEFEISAWEIGAGCTKSPAAFVINSGGMAAGAFSSPRRVLAAFVRGRRSRALYGEAFEPLLDKTVGEMRAQFIADSQRTTAGDVAAFIAMTVTGALIGLVELALFLPLVPVGLAAMWLRRRRAARTPGTSVQSARTSAAAYSP